MPPELTPEQTPDGQTPEQPPFTAPQPTAETKASLRGAGLRYNESDEVPEWARGKTADEIVQMADRMFGYMQQQQYQATPAPQQNYAPDQSSLNANSGYGPPDADLAYSDPAAYHRQMLQYQQALVQQQVSQIAMPVLQNQAETARELSRRDPAVADVWQKYAPEIEVELAGIPAYQRNKQLYDKAAEIVRGRHWKDYARDEASRLAASVPATERFGESGGHYPGSARDALDDFFDSNHPYVGFARSQGMTKEMVRQQLRTMGTSAEDWVKGAKAGSVINSGNVLQRSF